MSLKKNKKAFIFVLFVVIAVLLLASLSYFFPLKYDNVSSSQASTTPVFVATHIKTPPSVKALYMTSWVAGDRKLRERLVKIIDETELNSVIIDVKDYTGKISFLTEDEFLKSVGSAEKRIPDIREFIKTLHDKNIYVIARISVFQDAYMVKRRPDLAVKKKSAPIEAWKDFKGISWLDPGSMEVWDYTVKIGKEAYANGFDELNFDYIRFPSDGNMKDIFYPFDSGKPKAEVIKDFFAYLSGKLLSHGDIPLSADLFGMTATNKDDLNIGQILENALLYFDFVAPMVYPSHYPPNFLGFSNPSERPYEVVKFSMDEAVKRANLASTTPLKLRPWLQDFDLGAIYTPEKIRAQIQAVYDSSLSSWMLWDASNKYTPEALVKEAIRE